MDKAVTIAVTFTLVLALGCVTQPQQTTELKFADGLAELKAIESESSLDSGATLAQLEAGKSALSALRQSFAAYSATRDSAALLALTDFRLSYLDVQISARSGLDKLDEIEATCENRGTISSALADLELAVNQTALAVQAFNSFKENYPEYLNQTSINPEFDIELLENADRISTSIEQTGAQLQGCE